MTSNFTDPPYVVTKTTGYGRHAVFSFPWTITVSNQEERNKAIYVKAEGDKKVSVYAFNVEEQGTSDAFQVYPCHEYAINGTRYIYMIMSAEGLYSSYHRIDLNSHFLMVGCNKAETNAKLYPSATAQVPGSTAAVERGSDVDVAIGDGHGTFLVESQQDLTGTVVLTNKPIALFTGHHCANVPFGTPACDHLVEQVPPHITWGRLFFTVPVTG